MIGIAHVWVLVIVVAHGGVNTSNTYQDKVACEHQATIINQAGSGLSGVLPISGAVCIEGTQ